VSLRVLPALAGAIFLSSCGYIGNPQAPAIDLPVRVSDMQVIQYADQIIATFTLPLLTTEGMPLHDVRSIDLRIGVPPTPWSDAAWAASAKKIPVDSTPGHKEVPIPAAEWIGKEVVVRVRATGPKGKTSDWSNILTLPIEAPLPKPTDLTIVNAPTGLYIGWHYTGKPDAKFRVYLKVGDEEPKYRETHPFMGHNEFPIEFGTKYQFFIQAMDGELHLSEAAASDVYTPQDTFSPTVPAGLTGTLGASTVELSWERNTDERFQGYNVFRSVAGAPAEKIASLITTPVYSDSKVESGKTYRYTVSAVGTNGIESAQSAPFEIPVP
jgi:hypothetical protein